MVDAWVIVFLTLVVFFTLLGIAGCVYRVWEEDFDQCWYKLRGKEYPNPTSTGTPNQAFASSFVTITPYDRAALAASTNSVNVSVISDVSHASSISKVTSL